MLHLLRQSSAKIEIQKFVEKYKERVSRQKSF